MSVKTPNYGPSSCSGSSPSAGAVNKCVPYHHRRSATIEDHVPNQHEPKSVTGTSSYTAPWPHEDTIIDPATDTTTVPAPGSDSAPDMCPSWTSAFYAAYWSSSRPSYSASADIGSSQTCFPHAGSIAGPYSTSCTISHSAS